MDVGLLNCTVNTLVYAGGGVCIGSAIAALLLPFFFTPKSSFVGDLLAVGLKSAPAFVFPLAVGQVFSGTSWGHIAVKMIVSGLVCFFPILTGARDGRSRVPVGLRRTCDAYGASRGRRLLFAEWGWIGSGVAGGLKTAVPLAVVGAIIAEYVSATESSWAGLGARMSLHRNSPHELWVDIGASTFVGCVMFWAAAGLQWLAERRLRLAG